MWEQSVRKDEAEIEKLKKVPWGGRTWEEESAVSGLGEGWS